MQTKNEKDLFYVILTCYNHLASDLFLDFAVVVFYFCQPFVAFGSVL
jgi:hypothetical protein